MRLTHPLTGTPVAWTTRHRRPAETITLRRYRGPMPNPPEPEIIEAAAEIGIDPQALRNFLDSGRHQHADPGQPDGGPAIAAELAKLRAELDPS